MTSSTTPDGEWDPYFLPRGELEFERLNKQHAIYKKHACDNRLIYDKAVKLGDGDCVLDAGAGTCIWTLEVAKESPTSVQFYATDISSGNFPPIESTPLNVHMSVASSTSLLPEWSEKFAFVHQRLLFGALRATAWPIALSEMFRILKPGGALQLMEVRLPQPKGSAMASFTELIIALFEKRFHNMPIGKKWDDLGVESVQDLKTLKAGLRNLAPALRAEGLIQSDADYCVVLDKMEREWNEIGATVEVCLVSARKPDNVYS